MNYENVMTWVWIFRIADLWTEGFGWGGGGGGALGLGFGVAVVVVVVVVVGMVGWWAPFTSGFTKDPVIQSFWLFRRC